MRAVSLDATLRPRPTGTQWAGLRLSTERVPAPVIQAPDDVLVAPLWVGLCGSDHHLCEQDAEGYTRFPGPARPPIVLGHELSGKVVALGADVQNVRLGERVAAESIEACFTCPPCLGGHLNECEHAELVGLSRDGALAPLIRLKARHVYSIEPMVEALGEERGMEVGTLLEPLGVAFKGLYVEAGGVTERDVVVVFGLGPIGLLAVALALSEGARVMGFDLDEERCALARTLGAEVANAMVLGENPLSPRELIHSRFGRGGTLAVDATGDDRVFELALDALDARGRLVYLGRTASRVSFDCNPALSKGLRVFFSRGHAGYGIFETLIQRLASGSLVLDRIVTRRVDFEGAVEALRTPGAGKTLVRVGAGPEPRGEGA